MRYFFTAMATLFCLIFIGNIPSADNGNTKEVSATPDPVMQQDVNTRRQERIARRAARQAEYERFLDSTILSHNYRFIPSQMQVEPAGSPQPITSALSELAVYDDWGDINLPYLRGMMPPYRMVILNNTFTPNNYVAVQTDDGWTITFSSWLYSANNYNFTLNIFSKSGSAQLYIASTFYSTVSYWGSIVAVY